MKTELNNIKVFNLSSGKSLSQFIEESARTKKSLRYNTEYRNRLELIQDFEFPTASSKVHVSSDGDYIGASGVYPSQFRLFETSELSMKFQRNLDSEIIQFAFLTPDYRKLAFLNADRSIELHAQYGKHYSTRIPRFGHDMKFHEYSAELIIVGATNETYRLNLEQGRFMAPLESNVCEELSVCEIIKEVHWVVATGGVDGLVECWDLRQKQRTALIDPGQGEVTALAFDKLSMVTGHSNGEAKIYDIRYQKPLFGITHKNRLPVKSVTFHNEFVLTADPKALKICDRNSGAIVTTVESVNDIHQVECVENTGIVFMANEGQRVGTYFLPALGPAPNWCSFIEALNDEIEDEKVKINENKQFVTVEELEKLAASELIGTDELVGYMHGYLMDSKLYYKLKALSEPFDYKEYRKERIAKKLEEKTKERITVPKKLPKVNKNFVTQVLNEDPKGKNAKSKEILQDDRFKYMFEDPAFEINQESEDFRRIYRKRVVMGNEPTVVEEEEEDEEAEIMPKLKKKRKVERELREEPEDGEENLPFAERMVEEKPEKRVKKVKKPKVLKEKPDLEGRRTIVPMQKLLHAKNKDYRK